MKGNKKNEKDYDSPELTFEEKYPVSYYYYTAGEIFEVMRIVKSLLKKEKEKIEQELEQELKKMMKEKRNSTRKQIIMNIAHLIFRKEEIEKEIEKLEKEERR